MNPCVLIVEDDTITRFMMGEICDQLLYPHDFAATGSECMRMMRARPDRAPILMMDIHMPGLSGVETCARLRDTLRDRRVRPWIIAVTADEFWQNPGACGAAGFDGVLSKPISIDAVRRALQQATPSLCECGA